MKNEHDTATAELPVNGSPDTSRPEGLTLAQMFQINVKPQIRTETGWSDAELDELGESIMREGLLQLPLLRRDPESDTLIPVAGHRRIEAMKRKGFSEFYAIVGDADEAKAFRMQLAENIQREELSTREVANAVRKLADDGNTPAQIGEIVKKSKAWVSKHLSLTHPEFGTYARRLFERGEVEDLEILGSLSQAEKAATEKGHDGESWTIAQYPGNPWTRKEAAAAARRAKAMKHKNEELSENEEQNDESGENQLERLTADSMPQAFEVVAVLTEISEQFEHSPEMSFKDAFSQLVRELYSNNTAITGALKEILTAHGRRA